MTSALLPPKGRILIGEGLVESAVLMSQALENAGYQVTMAADGEECLRLARETLPDLIAMDIIMPKMHGFDVLRSLRSDLKTRDMGIIMCSGKDFKTDRDLSELLGAFDCLNKPIAMPLLVARVEAYFGWRAVTSPPMISVPEEARAEGFSCTLDASRPHIELWGTRGSTPTVGAKFQRHGGNTSCLAPYISTYPSDCRA